MKIVSVAQMIELEQRSAEAGAPPDLLMENAGLAVAEKARDLMGEVTDRSVLILVGPGNNGGDGLVAARHLHDWGARVQIFLCNRRTGDDKNFALTMERKIPSADALDREGQLKFLEALVSTDLFVDSLFGTGRVRPFEGTLKELLEAVTAEKSSRPEMKILAVDLPSGLDADTGEADAATIKADRTVTFACPKTGLFQFPGAALTGQLEIADIGIPEDLANHIATELMTADMIRSLLPARPLNANKGTFGKLMVIAGSINYVGAAYLACEAAMRSGTGLVTLATPASLQPMLAAKLTETTWLPLDESQPGILSSKAIPAIEGQLPAYDALLIGCGLGQNRDTVEFIKKLLPDGLAGKPLLIDADGLNILSEMDHWWQNLEHRMALTPHPGEMARLTGKPAAEIQRNRLETALMFSGAWKQTVVLKGAFTVVASPEGRANVCGLANPGLASAGTGDVLAGTIAGLMAQGLPAFEAATCGVFLHATAGEMVRAEIGDTGMIASDLLLALPVAIRQIKDA